MLHPELLEKTSLHSSKRIGGRAPSIEK